MLYSVQIKNYPINGVSQNIALTYELFGAPLHSAPVVLVNHALTGNSHVAGETGWWKKVFTNSIDLRRFTLIAFNIPGNGYAGTPLIDDYAAWNTRIVADLFWKALGILGVGQLYAAIGGSLGGGICWEMALQRPTCIAHLIPIACNVRSSDWVIGNMTVQEQLLLHSAKPVEHARMHAMLLYRTPESFREKFGGSKSETGYTVESWLHYHGTALQQRFHLKAYLLMNHLLRTVGQHVTDAELAHFARETTAHIHCISIDSDYLFTNEEQQRTYKLLRQHHAKCTIDVIQSIHGHDAFLIEFDQLNRFLNPIFK